MLLYIASIKRSLYELLVVHALRPDRLLASAYMLVNSAFGPEFMQQDKVVNLHEIVEKEVFIFFLFLTSLKNVFRCQAKFPFFFVPLLALTPPAVWKIWHLK